MLCCCCCCSSVDSTKTTLVIRGLLGLALFVRAQMADEADPCSEGSGTEGTRDEWDISRRVDCTGLRACHFLSVAVLRFTSHELACWECIRRVKMLGETCLGQHHCVLNFILPLYAEDLPEACCMKVFKLPCMALIHSACFTCI